MTLWLSFTQENSQRPNGDVVKRSLGDACAGKMLDLFFVFFNRLNELPSGKRLNDTMK